MQEYSLISYTKVTGILVRLIYYCLHEQLTELTDQTWMKIVTTRTKLKPQKRIRHSQFVSISTNAAHVTCAIFCFWFGSSEGFAWFEQLVAIAFSLVLFLLSFSLRLRIINIVVEEIIKSWINQLFWLAWLKSWDAQDRKDSVRKWRSSSWTTQPVLSSETWKAQFAKETSWRCWNRNVKQEGCANPVRFPRSFQHHCEFKKHSAAEQILII